MKVLSDGEFAVEWLRFFGPIRGVRLLGWASLSVSGAPIDADRAWLLEHGVGSVSTRYRNLSELRRFAAELESRGLSAAPMKGQVAAPARYLIGAVK